MKTRGLTILWLAQETVQLLFPTKPEVTLGPYQFLACAPLESRIQGQKIAKKKIHFGNVAGGKEAGAGQGMECVLYIHKLAASGGVWPPFPVSPSLQAEGKQKDLS